MKSVFHLCEALCNVAWDGNEQHREALNPWKSADGNPHPEWDGRDDADWDYLFDLARDVAEPDRPTGFLLWIPLRSKRLLQRPDGTQTGAIIQRFPGNATSPGSRLSP
jgi:hypothetical protein